MIQRLLQSFFILLVFSSTSTAQVSTVAEDTRGRSRRIAHEVNITMDPALGYVPKHRLVQAYDQKRAQRSVAGSTNSLANLVWIERGPNSDAVGPSNGNTRAGNGKTSGRVRAIWEDLADPTGKTVWVGGIDGGLWKTTDITINPANWICINDFFGNLAVSSICQDPSNPDIMYFGTGEKALNADAVRGAGIWQSLDHGMTWSVMPGTANYYNVSKIVCDNEGNLYVGTNTGGTPPGLLRYTKATSTWANITPSGLSTRITDIEMSSTGRLHVSCGYYNTAASSSGYRYTSNPATVTSATWNSPSTSFTTQYNVDIASAGNTLYALPANSSWVVPAIYKSTDGGANWSATATTPSFANGQAWYCMAIAVDPVNPNNVIVGSLDCYKTTNGGSTWTKISEWVGTAGQYVHADQQCMSWRSNNQVLIGSDGGVHYSANGGTTISDRNTGLRIKQFYAIAHHPTNLNYYLAGAQDNGVHQLSSAGLGNSVEVTGGDGAFVHIDQDQPQYQWGSYVYNQYRRSTNGGSGWSSVNYSSSAGRFINPTDYDDVNNRMYCSGNANTFVRWDNPQSGNLFTAVTMSLLNTGTVSAVKVSPFTNNTVFFGGGKSGTNPTLIKAINANTSAPAFTIIIGSSMVVAGANISSIEFGSSENTMIVTFSNYGVNNVWVTTNGGSSWTSVDGNLPDMPVRWAIFYPGDDTRAIIATETGVWESDLLNGTSTVWTANPTFPNVRTDMLQYRAADGSISAATHGRGVFTTLLSSAISCGNPAGLTSSNITVSGATLSWTGVSNATGYDVEYKETASATWLPAVTSTTATSYSLSGLTQGTTYDWRVVSHCSEGDGSYVAAQFTTATPFVCYAPTGLSASNISSNSARLSWTAINGSTSYDVEYKENSASGWISAGNTSNTFMDINGLNPSTIYDWKVKTNCADTTTDFATSQFTTSAAFVCNQPAGLNSTSVTSGSATLAWGAVNGAVSYDVDYKANASGTWINAATSASSLSVNLAGLSASTLYDWRIRTNCSGSTSGYSVSQFTTAASGCPDILEPNNTLSTARAISTGVNYNALIANSTDNDYYSFSNTSALKKIKVTLSGLPADYDLRLYKPNGQLYATSSNSGTTTETIIYNATKNNEVGTYEVYVYGFNGAFNSTQCYTLNVQIGSSNFTGAEGQVNGSPDVRTVRTGNMKLYPVPATTSVTVSFDAFAKADATITIINQAGQVVLRQVVGVADGINYKALDISKLESGAYTLQVKTGSKTYSEKLVVNK